MHREFFGEKLARRIGSDMAATGADPADQQLLFDELAGAPIGKILEQAFTAVAAKRACQAVSNP